MKHRIVITGAESTGKTTLARALSAHYQEPWTAEFVRNYVDQLQRDLQVQDLSPIAAGQLALEDRKLQSARQLIIHDTNILSSILYAEHYFDTVLDWVQQRSLQRDYSLYLLCMPDIRWQADPGQRDSTDAREHLHQRFKDTLDHLQVPYIKISGTEQGRMVQAIAAIDAMQSAEQTHACTPSVTTIPD